MVKSSLRQVHCLFSIYSFQRSKFSIILCKKALDETCLKHKELVKLLLLCSVIRTKSMTDYLYFVLKDKKSVKDIKIHLNNSHSAFYDVCSRGLQYENGSHFLGEQSPVDILSMNI